MVVSPVACKGCVPLSANTRRWPNVGLMMGQRRRRRPNIKPALGQCLVFVTGTDRHNPSLPANPRDINAGPVSCQLLKRWPVIQPTFVWPTPPPPSILRLIIRHSAKVRGVNQGRTVKRGGTSHRMIHVVPLRLSTRRSWTNGVCSILIHVTLLFNCCSVGDVLLM